MIRQWHGVESHNETRKSLQVQVLVSLLKFQKQNTLTADAYIENWRQSCSYGSICSTLLNCYTFNQAGANKAAFFSNAIDTESKGIDIVISHGRQRREWIDFVICQEHLSTKE
jgi:hypothetical protein